MTEISPKTRETAEKQLERLKAENEKLRRGIQEIKQGVIFAAKDGKMNILLYEVDPHTEYPVKEGTHEAENGKIYNTYKAGKWLYVNEAELYAVGAGERNACNIYFTRRK